LLITDKQETKSKIQNRRNTWPNRGRTKVQAKGRMTRLALALTLACGVVLGGTAASALGAPPQAVAAPSTWSSRRRRPSPGG
jgi:hypothetical protein